MLMPVIQQGGAVKATRAVRTVVVAAIMVVGLLLTSCDLFASKDPGSAAEVGENGANLTVDGVRIAIPAGAVPAGTKVDATYGDRVPSGLDDASLLALAKPFKIGLGDGLQPTKPLTVTIPVNRDLLADELSEDTTSTVAMMVESEGSSVPNLVPAEWDPVAGTLTAEVPHLSWLTPVQLDLRKVIRAVRDSVLQGLGIEYPKPGCADKPVTVVGRTYTAVSPAQAWVCVGESSGTLTVTAGPNSPIPFMVTSTPSGSATNKTEVSAGTAFSVALAQNLDITSGSRAIMMPGADAQFTIQGAPDQVTLDFREYSPMLLMSILVKTLDVTLGKMGNTVHLDKIAAAGCMQNILDTSQAGSPLSSAVAGGIVKSFFGCVGTVLELTLPAQIVLGILSAGPQFFVASALGLVNEMTGDGTFSATVTSSKKDSGGPTRFVTLDPWTDGSLDLVAEKTYDGAGRPNATCSSSSLSDRKDAFRCFWPGVDDPCFQSPSNPRELLCFSDNHGKLNLRHLTNMAVATPVLTGEPGETAPVRVELTDGTVCSRRSGAGPVGVPGYPFWAGVCAGPSAGVWRVGEADEWKDDRQHYTLYRSPAPGGHWQVAISVGNETAPAQRFDVKTVYR